MPERIMLFCIASVTDWQKAGVTHATAQHLMIRGLIDRHAAGSFILTDQGRAVLEAPNAGGDERVTHRCSGDDPRHGRALAAPPLP